MPQDVTFTDAARKFQSIAGLETLTSADTFFLSNSFNRSALNAYHESNLWPRFLRVGEERSLSSEPVSTVTYTYPTEIKIGDYPIVFGQSILLYPGSFSFLFNGVYQLGLSINSMPAWYFTNYENYSFVISIGADTQRYGLYRLLNNELSSDPIFLFDRDDDNIILPTAYYSEFSINVYDPSNGQTSYYSSNLNNIGEISQYFQFEYNGSSSSQSTVLADNVVPYTELNKDNIGEFIRIHKERPYGVRDTEEYEFYVDSNGANIVDIPSGVTSAFVTYKKAYNPSFTDESTDIPQEFLDYMLYCALSDFYTGDGQTENAAVAMNRATMSLDSELFRLEQKNNMNIMGIRFSTHLNRQHR